ncbi:hypothetical protein PPL_07495 [Heterostelium album PN500]|uniref:Uncharacterized protein n=1 Tax=Heterostelium pallidum (strain ATCC 26659 / Pp 5 / PN500) TaxID=670386 RepID=D3BG44_HETP5|nr:hypothetical protein PPL_07495 [Heterostelium album PN500]EFA79636.1 hypothetical protein PPL_07495 [Heterostelium album PN500]|eukprot:XP_020431757.1 hypothetical protein PPL_07495 [Heterostelium album PN500]
MKEITINHVLISPNQSDLPIETKFTIEIEFKVLEKLTDFNINIEYIVDTAFLNHKVEKVNYEQQETIKMVIELPKTFKDSLPSIPTRRCSSSSGYYCECNRDHDATRSH